MSWAKVDDQWFASRKVVPLSLSTRGLWVTVLSWTCAQQSPHIPGHMATFLAGGEPIRDHVEQLIEHRLWHDEDHDCDRCEQPEPGGWIIHDWAEYQDKSVSEKRAEAGRKGGLRSGENRRQKKPNEANGKQTKQRNEANDEAGTRPVPSRPVPTRPEVQTRVAPHGDDGEEDPPGQPNRHERDKPPPEHDLDAFGQAYPRHRDNGKPWGGGSRQRTKQRWQNLTTQERQAAILGAKHYADDVQRRAAPVKHADGWLSERRWETWQQPAQYAPPQNHNRGIDHANRYHAAAAELERAGR